MQKFGSPWVSVQEKSTNYGDVWSSLQAIAWIVIYKHQWDAYRVGHVRLKAWLSLENIFHSCPPWCVPCHLQSGHQHDFHDACLGKVLPACTFGFQRPDCPLWWHTKSLGYDPQHRWSVGQCILPIAGNTRFRYRAIWSTGWWRADEAPGWIYQVALLSTDSCDNYRLQ